MIELPSSNDIEKISLNILKGSKSFGVFPTPVDRIIAYSELNIDKKLDISAVHENYLHNATDALFKALAKLRGLFDRKQKIIYLDLKQAPSRKNFVKLHEAAHGLLPWQQSVHDVLEDDDDSLSAYVTDEFEAEANYFASVTLFQHDSFINELNKYNLSIESVFHLAKLYGASRHATLRRYVEFSGKRCALLVLEKVSDGDLSPMWSKRNLFASKRFVETFGDLELPEEFGASWAFAKNSHFQRMGIITGNISIQNEAGLVNFNYQFFNNSYNGLVFLFPIGEKQSSRTTFIVSEFK